MQKHVSSTSTADCCSSLAVPGSVATLESDQLFDMMVLLLESPFDMSVMPELVETVHQSANIYSPWDFFYLETK